MLTMFSEGLYFNPILDGGGGGKFAPYSWFFNTAQKQVGVGN